MAVSLVGDSWSSTLMGTGLRPRARSQVIARPSKLAEMLFERSDFKSFSTGPLWDSRSYVSRHAPFGASG